jgi:hypothetical protein
VALYYADASALVKLVRDEPESPALRTFIADADLASCDLVLAEVPRAIRRAAALDPRLDLEVLITRAGAVIDAVALVPVDRTLRLGPSHRWALTQRLEHADQHEHQCRTAPEDRDEVGPLHGLADLREVLLADPLSSHVALVHPCPTFRSRASSLASIRRSAASSW